MHLGPIERRHQGTSARPGEPGDDPGHPVGDGNPAVGDEPGNALMRCLQAGHRASQVGERGSVSRDGGGDNSPSV